MILAHLATYAHTSVSSLAMYLQDAGEPTVGFSPMQLWSNMGGLARSVVIILFIMSIWSLAVIIDRALYFSAARKLRLRRLDHRRAGGELQARPRAL